MSAVPQAAPSAPLLRAVIVDDEPLARERLRSLLDADPDIEVVGECGDGLDALEMVQRQHPDLVFLDVQIPRLDGFAVVERLGPRPTPLVVFVTAHDRYALKAFEVQAFDYLLKPFDRERFDQCLARAKARLAGGKASNRELLSLLRDLQPRPAAPERLMVRSRGRILFLRVEDIDWIRADRNYLEIHSGRATHRTRGCIASLAHRLEVMRFVRVHRSLIVNLDRISEIQPWFHGGRILILRDGTRLVASRANHHALDAAVGL